MVRQSSSIVERNALVAISYVAEIVVVVITVLIEGEKTVRHADSVIGFEGGNPCVELLGQAIEV
jgi:hypothetical protein